jgi:hypothetical protein
MPRTLGGSRCTGLRGGQGTARRVRGARTVQARSARGLPRVAPCVDLTRSAGGVQLVLYRTRDKDVLHASWLSWVIAAFSPGDPFSPDRARRPFNPTPRGAYSAPTSLKGPGHGRLEGAPLGSLFFLVFGCLQLMKQWRGQYGREWFNELERPPTSPGSTWSQRPKTFPQWQRPHARPGRSESSTNGLK